MRILLPLRPAGAFGFITDGWYNALLDCGHAVARWDGQEATWHEFQPDIYMGCSGHRQPIPNSRKSVKVAIHVNPYGPVDIGGINESQDAIRWVVQQRPDAVFGYGNESDRLLWSYWTTNHGILWFPMPTAADRTMFTSGPGLGLHTPLTNRRYDIVYLGGYWPYKAKTIDKVLLPVLRDATLTTSVRGWGDWPAGLCDGALPDEDGGRGVAEFLNTGKVAPCIAEPHTHQYGIDIPERVFKAVLCGCLVIHDSVPGVRQMLSSVIIARNPQHFHEMCGHYSRNDQERIALAHKQRQEVLNRHTYHHRMATMFAALGFTDVARDMTRQDR